MSDGEALLKAILEQPDDDTPRLVYADWLQENGLAFPGNGSRPSRLNRRAPLRRSFATITSHFLSS